MSRGQEKLSPEELEKIRSCPILFCGPSAVEKYREWIREQEEKNEQGAGRAQA